MDLGLRGRTAIVAAASKGLGKAVALGFAQEGANVVMFSRDQRAIDAAAKEVQGTGAHVVALPADVTSERDLQHVVQTAMREFGAVDIVYNNAGGPKPGMFDSLSDEDWQHAVELDLMSAIRLTRLCLPSMRERRWGRIITSTSSSVKQPIPNLMLSNSVRSATTAWSKTLADQVGPDGITVNVIAPGSISTDRLQQIDQDAAERAGRGLEELQRQRAEGIPLRRYGTPAEFAAAAIFLASEQAGYISGVTLLVDGGAFRGTY
ncbi:MAG: SDR family oxidoreductase [Chloroflexi bacterium]|nr:SDR family oxidoreductase [Chloroflexota bacterium]MBV9547416.1 SDR family oxidoreductase [Chloroflexota bacterium]